MLVAALTLITGLSVYNSYFFVGIIECISVVFIFLIGRAVLNVRSGLLAALLLVIANQFLLWGTIITPETLGIVLTLVVVAALFLVPRDDMVSYYGPPRRSVCGHTPYARRDVGVYRFGTHRRCKLVCIGQQDARRSGGPTRNTRCEGSLSTLAIPRALGAIIWCEHHKLLDVYRRFSLEPGYSGRARRRLADRAL